MDQTLAIHSSFALQIQHSISGQLLRTTVGKRLVYDWWDASTRPEDSPPLGNPLLAAKLAFSLLCVATGKQNSFNRLRIGPKGWRRII